MSSIAEVRLWGRTIGAVVLEEGRDVAAFEYDAAFTRSGIEIAPLTMPLSRRVYTFPELARTTFYGLPGLLADSLPDKFGNVLIDAWLATQGRQPDSFNAVERLCYDRTNLHDMRIDFDTDVAQDLFGQSAGGDPDGGRLFGGILVGRVFCTGEQQRVGVRRHFMDQDAHVVDHADNVLNLLRVYDILREVVVDFGIGQESLLLSLLDQQLES